MSENIWKTLTIAIGHLQRLDLVECVITGDLITLLREFHIE